MSYRKIWKMEKSVKAAGTVLLVFFCILTVAASQQTPEDKIAGLIKKLQNIHPNVRALAARELGKIKDPRAVPPLINALGDSNAYVRGQSAEALGKIKDVRAVQKLAAALKDDDYLYVRQESAKSLGKIKDPRAIAPLINALNDEYPAIREEAAKALVEIGAPAIDQMDRAVKENNLKAIADAYYFYICRGETGAQGALVEALNKYGTARMAVDFMNCGNVQLKKAAYEWAESHGHRFGKQTGSGKGPVWRRCS